MKKCKYVITITRQFGSLGRPIAKALAEKLDIEFYDRDIVDQAAKKLNLPASVIKEEEEKLKTPVKSSRGAAGNIWMRMAFPLGNGSSDMQDNIFEAQENIIRFLAERETCIIVGRCSDFILSEMENVFHVYIYAPYEDRVKNSVETLGMTEEEARRTIRSVDEAREAFHKHYAGYSQSDPLHKDLMINSSSLGVEKTAELLAQVIRLRFGEES
ncbi:MAG: cytidylate kinase-like family protein [Lachnospiraceae bacterium]|nr:cytidylate kinase-like family protein [Lachnospiraceae bacterium]